MVHQSCAQSSDASSRRGGDGVKVLSGNGKAGALGDRRAQEAGASPVASRHIVKVAACQVPLTITNSTEVLRLVQSRIAQCEAEGISILCCPEAVLGGLADHAPDPTHFAIAAATGQLEAMLAPLRSETVTTIVGFTEITAEGKLYNAAAVLGRELLGCYRKLYPAINRSVYEAGTDTPVFHVQALTFGVVICNDSNYREPARRMAAQGATALFIPTNNALPSSTGGPELVRASTRADIARALENRMWVIRADVAGRTEHMLSYGSSEIVDPQGIVVQSARPLSDDLIVAEMNAPFPVTR